jgi:hypothetical protein
VTDKQGIRLATVETRGASETTADKAFTQATTKFEIEATEKILMLWQRDGTYSCSWN